MVMVMVLVGLVFFGVAGYGVKQLYVNNKDKENVKFVETLTLVYAPCVGYGLAYLLSEEVEFFDWKYFGYLFVVQFCYTGSFFLSKYFKKRVGPLMLGFFSMLLSIGVAVQVLVLIHLYEAFFFSLVGVILYGLGVVGLLCLFALIYSIVLFLIELYNVLLEIVLRYKDVKVDFFLLKLLNRVLSHKYGVVMILVAMPLLFFIPLMVLLLAERSLAIDAVKVLVESSDGAFSKGYCDDCKHTNEYVCTVAAYGSKGLVKPIHIGRRGGRNIPVNRQLKVCNAFEEVLYEKAPKLQKVLRKKYDDLQIPIDKWKNVKYVSNVFYILIKPIEYMCLLGLYLFDLKPERRISRQYIESDRLKEFSNII